MNAKKFLLYGAYGYTGKLITRIASEYNVQPILAGRNFNKLEAQSESTGYGFRAFALDETEMLHAALNEVDLVLHAAGPFKYTSKPMIEACLSTGTHYLDITGEIEVFEYAKQRDEEARNAGILLMPGVGFDVVPSDSLAKYLQNKLPDATHLQLAFTSTKPGYSQGTALTMAENLGEGAARRENGKIVKVELGANTMTVPFTQGDRFVMNIPWGDVSSAYTTTGIPNIETFMGFSPKRHKKLKWQKYYNWLLRTNMVRNRLRKKIKSGPAGPSDNALQTVRSMLWGKVWNGKDQSFEARLEAPEGYLLTAKASLLITKKLLEGKQAKGYQTPAGLFGEDIIMEIPSVTREDI